MSNFTYQGYSIDDLLIECSRIKDPKARNEIFIERLQELTSRKVPEAEWGFMFGILSGMNFEFERKGNKL